MSDYLPQEVMFDIFFRLPIKSLVICTSVCKSWGSMIKSPSFIQTHLSHRRNYNDLHGTHLLLLHGVSCEAYTKNIYPRYIDNLNEEVYSLHYDNHVFVEYRKIRFQSPIEDGEMYNVCPRVVSICNGLVFLADDLLCYGYNFMIWNPSIRKSVTLPKPGLRFETIGGYNACHGFAYDAIFNDYKVVRLLENLDWNQTFVEVYSLAAGSWSDSRLVDHQCGLYKGSPQAFVNGALHWNAYGKRSSSYDESYHYFILAFDVSSELLREIRIPMSLESHLVGRDQTLQLTVSGDGKSLALFVSDSTRDSSTLDIWVMEEYSVQESWTKLYTLRPHDSADRLLRPLCFRKSGEVMLEIYHGQYGGNEDGIELFSLDLVSGQLKTLGISKYHYQSLHPLEESIVLLDRNDRVSC